MHSRRAGVLLHPTSLPGPGPLGTLGRAAFDFVDWLSAAGATVWQVLPLNPPGRGLSPYDSPGALVTSPLLLDLDSLVDQGLLERAEIALPSSVAPSDPLLLSTWHLPLARRAAARFADATDLAPYRVSHPPAYDWAVLSALLEHHRVESWFSLPPALRDRQPQALADAEERLALVIRREVALQQLVDAQWNKVRDHAQAQGIRILGDLPLFVSPDGVDPWVHRELFCWDAEGHADPVSGAPPDYFNERGQCWASPHYAWPHHEATGFRWWRERFKAVLRHADVVRVDHFRGLVAAWGIPAAAQGDARLGSWRPTPGRQILDAIRDEVGSLPVIAEDLGHITSDVDALRDDYGLMGMKVLQFAFGGEPDNPHLPAHWKHGHSVVYTGTHDNDTALGWYRAADEETRHRFRVATHADGSDPAWALLDMAWRSPAQWALAPLQDVLALGNEARMNTPGTGVGNWLWRAPAIPEDAGRRLAALARESNRDPRRQEVRP